MYTLVDSTVNRYQSIVRTLAQRAQDYDHQVTVKNHKMTTEKLLIELKVFHKVLAILKALPKIFANSSHKLALGLD